jgi:homoserine dehydrogenase
LAGLAFHSRVTDKDVYREGITKITAADVKVAKAMDMVIKLLAITELTSEGEISVRVHPALISRNHPLASVRESFNAVFVQAKSAGEMMFYGRGAGGEPTASAVLGDLVAIARHKVLGGIGPKESDYASLKIAAIGQTKTRYLIRLNVADKPGVLESVAHVFASHGVSIQTVRQSGIGDKAELIVMTHSSTELALATTVKELGKLPVVTDVASVLRVEGNI